MNNMKNLFELSEEQKNEIRNLHESYKNAYGTRVIKEQGDSTYTPNTDEIDVYYFGTAGPNTEKIYHDNEKIYYFDGETANVIWEKTSVAGYAYDKTNKKFELGSEMLDLQEQLQGVYKQLLLQSFGPLQYQWANTVKGQTTKYLVMFGDGGKMFLNAIAPVIISKREAKQKGLTKSVETEGYYYIDNEKTYLPIKGGKAVITEIGFGKQPITSKPTPPDVYIPREFKFTLNDPFEFDSDVLTTQGQTDLNSQLSQLNMFLKGAFNVGSLAEILRNPITLLGFASSDADPSANDGGNLPACKAYGPGKGPRGKYDQCLSEQRALRIKEKIDEFLPSVMLTRGGRQESIIDVFGANQINNWVKYKGMGQNSDKSKIDWKKPHNPSETSEDRRVEMYPSVLTAKGVEK
jgi:hypothetical protein